MALFSIVGHLTSVAHRSTSALTTLCVYSVTVPSEIPKDCPILIHLAEVDDSHASRRRVTASCIDIGTHHPNHKGYCRENPNLDLKDWNN